jgi:hypothetical protein
MIIDDEKKFIFVCVAKTASTSIRRRLGYEDDPPPEEYHMFLSDILNEHPRGLPYFKFGFVRNPYDRLFSTYINLKYDGHPWATALKQKRSFREFVIDFENSEYSNYIHLRPQSEYLTLDGKLGVDFLGRFENLAKDFREIEKKIGYSHKELSHIRSSSKNIEHKFYDHEMRKVVQKIYAEDFERFRYER